MTGEAATSFEMLGWFFILFLKLIWLEVEFKLFARLMKKLKSDF